MMNRHERRKQKKNLKKSSVVSRDLIKGIQFHTNKKYKEAEILYKKVLSSDPNNYDAIRHLGILNQDLQNFEGAFKLFIKAVKVNPKGFEALNNLGTIHLRNKNYDLAIKCLNKSLEIKNNYVPSINNLAGYYHKANKPKQALEFSSRSMDLQPENPMTKNQYAKALIINSRPDEAIVILEKLIEDFPENDDFKFNLSSAYREMGEFKKANKIASEGFKKNYKKIPYLLSYTSEKENKLDDKHIKYYDELLSGEEISPEDKVVIYHSFFNYFKNNKNYKKAGKYLVEGNTKQYSMKAFDIEQEKQFFMKIENIFKKEIKFKKLEKINSGVPIFICGMPRSGTTLCEQILSSHSKIDGAGELNYLAETSGIDRVILPSKNQINNFQSTLEDEKKLLAARNEYLKRLKTHSNKSATYICDKMPHNFILIGFIKLIIPEAKIIYCKRDPMDNCFSLYSHKFLELSHQYSYDQRTLIQYYKLHNEMMNFWLSKYKRDIFILDNEELVNNQEKISKKLIEFCGLRWEEDCLEFYKTKRQVRTASIQQVRNPINNKSIGAWKKYENYLSEMVDELNK